MFQASVAAVPIRSAANGKPLRKDVLTRATVVDVDMAQAHRKQVGGTRAYSIDGRTIYNPFISLCNAGSCRLPIMSQLSCHRILKQPVPLGVSCSRLADFAEAA